MEATEIKEQNGYQAEVDKPSQSSILTRTHAGYFRISLSFGTQALLRKVLSEPNNNGSQDVWHVFRMLPSTAFLLLWWLALLIQISLSLIYVLKCFFHFNLVKQEFLHYIGVNYSYAPWISWFLLLQSSPISISEIVPYFVVCSIFTVPIVMLDIKLGL
ncbi:hypothetical protein BDE02_04G006000 [Populus trichocarpa]|uniref:Uncharacterized protein n=1 Tax=Populus trichocarpa TaxID=3694 RepID=B9N8C9_POPTR|nr:hypothetical protein BDE02_04G006000 [Populus trichocarpa]